MQYGSMKKVVRLTVEDQDFISKNSMNLSIRRCLIFEGSEARVKRLERDLHMIFIGRATPLPVFNVSRVAIDTGGVEVCEGVVFAQHAPVRFRILREEEQLRGNGCHLT